MKYEQIKIKNLIKELKKIPNQEAIVYLPVDPEINGMHDIEPFTVWSYGTKTLKPLTINGKLNKDFNVETDIVVDEDKILLLPFNYFTD